jgi:hypothetical protein
MQSAANYSPPNSLLTGKNTGNFGPSPIGARAKHRFRGAFGEKLRICEKSKQGINRRCIRESKEPIREFLLHLSG